YSQPDRAERKDLGNFHDHRDGEDADRSVIRYMDVIRHHEHARMHKPFLNRKDVSKSAPSDIVELLDAVFGDDFTHPLLSLRRLRRNCKGLMVGRNQDAIRIKKLRYTELL